MVTNIQNNVAIVIIGKTKAMDDLALPLYFTLRKLKYNVCIVRNTYIPDATNILMDFCDYPNMDITKFPEDTIIYNLEQLVEGSKGVNKDYINACSQFTVWDYSEDNVKRFKEVYNIKNVCHVPFGYCPEMTRISPEYPKDIDVLLYGALNDRRIAMIAALQKLHINAIGFSGVFGLERDILIARSKLVMNVHYYIPGIQEIIRLGYLWANKKCVVCECNTDTSIHFGYENACIYAPYEEIPTKIEQILSHPKAITTMGNAAFLQFSNHPYTDILESIVGPAPKRDAIKSIGQQLRIPSFCNVGSGKNFLPEALNIDISPQWNPDIVMDISQPIPWGEKKSVQRFGTVMFKKGMFKKIRMFDVLEHVPNVIATMTNLLEMLCDGGELHLNVPYDLSLGAWQDPTHLHAFNENSWLYYTDWHWYIGWREERFDLQNIDYILSDLGKKLRSQGRNMDNILRMPRAVDSMEVLLKKRRTTFDEKFTYDKQTRSVYSEPQREWLASEFEVK
ncbi:MAG: methyltransferase domain-containing protein [Desulfovibrio sp.]|nr:methyltransferase domain-containing protein [Desulfovibrio sp.]